MGRIVSVKGENSTTFKEENNLFESEGEQVYVAGSNRITRKGTEVYYINSDKNTI